MRSLPLIIIAAIFAMCGTAAAEALSHMGENAAKHLQDSATQAGSSAADPFKGRRPGGKSINDLDKGAVVDWQKAMAAHVLTGVDPRYAGQDPSRGYKSPFESIRFKRNDDEIGAAYGFTGSKLQAIVTQGDELAEYGCLYLTQLDHAMMRKMGLDPVVEARKMNKEALSLGLVSERQKMNEMVATRLPGSRYDCGNKTGVIVDGNAEYTFSNGKLQLYKESGAVNYVIQYLGDRIIAAASADKQNISFVYFPKYPANSYFNDANLQIRADSAMQKYMGKNGLEARAATLQKNEMTRMVNDYYRAHSAKGTMLSLSTALLTSQDARNAMLDEIKRLDTKAMAEGFKRMKKLNPMMGGVQ